MEGSQIVACAGRTHLFDSASHQSTDRDEAQTLLDPGSKDVRQSLNTPPRVRDAVVKDYDGARDEILFNPASNVTHGWVCRVVSIRGAVYPCVRVDQNGGIHKVMVADFVSVSLDAGSHFRVTESPSAASTG